MKESVTQKVIYHVGENVFLNKGQMVTGEWMTRAYDPPMLMANNATIHPSPKLL